MRRSAAALAVIVGWLACSAATPGSLLAQTQDNATPSRAAPAWMAAGDAQAARGQRFADAVKDLAAGEAGQPGERSGATFYLMVDLPSSAAMSGERDVAIEFRGIWAQALAKFRAEMCGRGDATVEPRCAQRRVTITTSRKLPVEQACGLLEAALQAACAPSS